MQERLRAQNDERRAEDLRQRLAGSRRDGNSIVSALAFDHAGDVTARDTATELSERPGTHGRTIVTITKSNLLDDSVYAVRYQIELQQMLADTLFRFIRGEWAQQCQPARGHQDFTKEPCT